MTLKCSSQMVRTTYTDHAALFWFRRGDESISNAIDLKPANSFHWLTSINTHTTNAFKQILAQSQRIYKRETRQKSSALNSSSSTFNFLCKLKYSLSIKYTLIRIYYNK